jgi:putative transposase
MEADMAIVYRTAQIPIKKGHKLYGYFEDLMFKSKNLFNTSNYYIRQLFTCFAKDLPSSNEKEALNYINGNIDALNVQRHKKYLRKVENGSAKAEFKVFSPVSKEHPLTYELLDGIFKISKHPDYYGLPAQLNQGIMKLVFRNWQSFWKSISDYHKHPHKYNSRPKIPGYSKNPHKSMLILTNQICKLKGQYLRFPKTNLTLNVGKYYSDIGTLKEVRVLPKKDILILEVVYAVEIDVEPLNPNNIASIDIGVNNLVTMVNNVGENPVIVKGSIVKSINQYYNKTKAQYTSAIRSGKNHKQGSFHTKRLSKLDRDRHLRLKDYFHKTSYQIIEVCKKHDIGTLIIGKNEHFKKNVKLQKKDKQNFIHIPFVMLINMIKYKAEANGIQVIVHEESYTSKASFLDQDPIPTYGDAFEGRFSGKRIKRGMYKTKEGHLINADVNAAYNIMIKVVPNALEEIRDRGVGLRAVMSTPLVLKIA